LVFTGAAGVGVGFATNALTVAFVRTFGEPTWRLSVPSLWAAKGECMVLVSATVCKPDSTGLFLNQITSTISTMQMTVNQVIERLIFIVHQFPMLKPNCEENSNVFQ
jgi:hypothetical protein